MEGIFSIQYGLMLKLIFVVEIMNFTFECFFGQFCSQVIWFEMRQWYSDFMFHINSKFCKLSQMVDQYVSISITVEEAVCIAPEFLKNHNFW